MCYYPYFRGKQYELITIRENAELLKNAGFIPIIEPVKESFSGLKTCVNTIIENDGNVIVIINPDIGDYSKNPETITSFLKSEFDNVNNIIYGLYLSEKYTFDKAEYLIKQYSDKSIAYIHAGYSEPKLLMNIPNVLDVETIHVFNENNCGKIYQRNFNDNKKILLRDG